jgi:NAD(P)-dependent dehydrogenase (short-subunit alcohol dehydrogenase family)
MVTEDIEIMGTDKVEEQTQSIPLRRFGRPEDVADTAVYLASDLSDYVTGESILVDGGSLHGMM